MFYSISNSIRTISILLICFQIAPSLCYAQFSQPGELDTTFNFGGIQHAFFAAPANPNLGEGAAFGEVKVAIRLSNGKVIIGGNFTTYNGSVCNHIARLNENGSFDSTFNQGTGVAAGLVTSVNAIAIQPDGKLLIGGDFNTYNGTPRNRIARLNIDGSVDNTFNSAAGANNTVHAIAIQPNGKILVGGSFTNFFGITRNKLVRLNADGSVDSSFNVNSAVFSGNVLSTAVFAIECQPDGKILIGGYFTSQNGITRTGLVRLNADGSLDQAFNTGTHLSTVYAIALQPDGKVIIGGAFSGFNSSRRSLARLNTNGMLDSTFNQNNGLQGNFLTSSIHSIGIQPDGKVLIGGEFTTFSGIPSNRITRIFANGTLDTTFNPGLSGANNKVSHLFIQPNGQVLISGTFSTYNFRTSHCLALLNADGSRDSMFNPSTGTNGDLLAVVVQPDGKVIIAGRFERYNGRNTNRIIRINADGSRDSTYNIGTGANNTINAVALQPDGKALIGGWFDSYNGTSRQGFARLNQDGSLDLTLNASVGGGQVNTICIQPDGRILIGGNFIAVNGTTRNRIARLNANGTLDVSFNPGTGFNGGAIPTVRTITIQADGKILVGGDYTLFNGGAQNGIARLNPNGTLDTSFNIGSGIGGGPLPSVRCIMYRSDGRILLGGAFSTFNGTPRINIVRLNSNGSIDTSFNAGIGTSGVVIAFRNQPDSNIMIAGYFDRYNGIAANQLACVYQNGQIDTSFNSGTASNQQIHQIAFQNNGRLLIIGSFTNYQGIYRSRIARIFATTCFTFPPAPAPMTSMAICEGTRTTITPIASGQSYRFYSDSVGGTPIIGGDGVSSFTTPILTSSTVYYVSSVSADGCESPNRTAVTVTVTPLPFVQISQNGDSLTSSMGQASYQWLLNGFEIAGATGINFRPTLSGTYSLRVTDTLGCVNISNTIDFIATGLDFGSDGNPPKWSAFPIPFGNNLFIKAELPFHFELIDAKGIGILEGKSETTEITCPTEMLPVGIYVLKITFGGQMHLKKIIKM